MTEDEGNRRTTDVHISHLTRSMKWMAFPKTRYGRPPLEPPNQRRSPTVAATTAGGGGGGVEHPTLSFFMHDV
ncbi:hypothetical protein L6452_42465 [Arctium lappa]|uniref:Uncharacterized protein n=1 Tax=Arctium lappa TaxID=4217 RepID=A0ACB8XHQ4_ARCLA|nr:hypothetical protein L6452_42465 [Arctium lappa]